MTRDACAARGIDVEASYRQLLLEIMVGGPVFDRLCDALEGWKRANLSPEGRPHGQRILSVKRNADPKGLTPREIEVLELYAHGMSSKTIARYLFINFETVRTHSSHARRKLEARNTTHAVAISIRRGYIQPPGR